MIAALANTIARRPLLAPAAALLASGALIGGAWAFQLWGGLAPCELCLLQRWPHYAVLALALALLALPVLRGGDRRLLGAALALFGLGWAASAAIAGFHVGVEQHWWKGLEACSGAGIDGNLSLDALKAQILAAPVVRCDEIPWSLFGISMAGYNFLFSAGLAIVAFTTATRMIGPAAAARTATP